MGEWTPFRFLVGVSVTLFVMFRAYSWNVRGPNDLSKRFVVRDVISILRNVVVCHQETKVHSILGSFLHSFGDFSLNKCVFIESEGASGVLTTCWSSRIFLYHEVIVQRYSITVLISLVNNGSRFYVIMSTGRPPGTTSKIFIWSCFG